MSHNDAPHATDDEAGASIVLGSVDLGVSSSRTMLALHYSSTVDERFWTHAALIFTTMYAVFGTVNASFSSPR